MAFFRILKTIFIALLGISFVIVIHEFGHFFAAKTFGVRVPIFSIGFGPELFSFYLGGTKFALSFLLLGGYVSLNPSDLAAQPYFAKMIIILAGIVVNILFAFIVFKALGIRPKVNIAHPGDSQSSQKNSPEINSEQTDSGKTEITNEEGTAQKAKRLFSSYDRQFIGPFGIFSLLGKSFEQGFDVFLYLLAILSLNVAIFNLLPLQFFDGGQALNYTVQALVGPNLAYLVMRLVNFLLFIFIIIFFMLSGTKRNR